MDNYRRSNLTVIHGGKNDGQLWRMIQISICGLDVWRRAIVSHDCTMEQLNQIIQISMNWKGILRFRFYCETSDGGKEYLHDKIKLGDIDFRGKKEIMYEYGVKWNVKIIIMSSYQPAKDDICRFIAGSGDPPPEQVDGPRHFRKLLVSVETGGTVEKTTAQRELGLEFTPGFFDLEKTNRDLRAALINGEKNEEKF